MKKFTLKKKLIAGAAVAALTLGVGGAAFSYFSAGGSGSGTGTVGTSSAVTITGTAGTAVTPNGATSDVTIVVHNPGTGSQTVGAVSLSGVAADSLHSTCDTSVFSMPDTTAVGVIAAGGNATVHSTLSMADNGLNQDDCQGATLTLSFTSV